MLLTLYSGMSTELPRKVKIRIRANSSGVKPILAKRELAGGYEKEDHDGDQQHRQEGPEHSTVMVTVDPDGRDVVVVLHFRGFSSASL